MQKCNKRESFRATKEMQWYCVHVIAGGPDSGLVKLVQPEYKNV